MIEVCVYEIMKKRLIYSVLDQCSQLNYSSFVNKFLGYLHRFLDKKTKWNI